MTAKVVGHVLGKKIRIGKYKKRTGYKRHNGFRASLSQVQIETIGKKAHARRGRSEDGREAQAEPKPRRGQAEGDDRSQAEAGGAAKPKATTAAKPRTPTTKKPATEKAE